MRVVDRGDFGEGDSRFVVGRQHDAGRVVAEVGADNRYLVKLDPCFVENKKV